jgi:hypothetical protein
MVLFSTFGVLLSHAVHIRSRRYSEWNQFSSPVIRLRQLLCAEIRSLGSNCAHIVIESGPIDLSAYGESTVKLSEYSQSWTYNREPSHAKSTGIRRLFEARRSSLLAGLIEYPHRFRIEILSRDVFHFDVRRCSGEHRFSIKIVRLDNKHLGRMHFECILSFRHPDTLRKTRIR